MTQLFSNNANTVVAVQLGIADTVLILSVGSGAKFSSPTAGDYELITLYVSDTIYEVVQCTGRSNDVLTIVRGVEGTAQQWLVGTKVSSRITKKTLTDLVSGSGEGLPEVWDPLHLRSMVNLTWTTDLYTIIMDGGFGEFDDAIYDLDYDRQWDTFYIYSDYYDDFHDYVYIIFPEPNQMGWDYPYGTYLERTLIIEDTYGVTFDLYLYNNYKEVGIVYSDTHYAVNIYKMTLIVGVDPRWTLSQVSTSQ
ncbi:MAG: hypothetical protein GQ570_03950 [Helicobacteraceae bacterium]|nr:hypothetical protein [Helicobacteraceae bacterium]